PGQRKQRDGRERADMTQQQVQRREPHRRPDVWCIQRGDGGGVRHEKNIASRSTPSLRYPGEPTTGSSDVAIPPRGCDRQAQKKGGIAALSDQPRFRALLGARFGALEGQKFVLVDLAVL